MLLGSWPLRSPPAAQAVAFAAGSRLLAAVSDPVSARWLAADLVDPGPAHRLASRVQAFRAFRDSSRSLRDARDVDRAGRSRVIRARGTTGYRRYSSPPSDRPIVSRYSFRLAGGSGVMTATVERNSVFMPSPCVWGRSAIQPAFATRAQQGSAGMPRDTQGTSRAGLLPAPVSRHQWFCDQNPAPRCPPLDRRSRGVGMGADHPCRDAALLRCQAPW